MCLADITEQAIKTDIQQVAKDLLEDMPEANILPYGVTVNDNGDWIYSFFPKDNAIEVSLLDNNKVRLIKYVDGGFVGGVMELKQDDLADLLFDQGDTDDTYNNFFFNKNDNNDNKQLMMYGKFEVGIMQLGTGELSLMEEIELLEKETTGVFG